MKTTLGAAAVVLALSLGSARAYVDTCNGLLTIDFINPPPVIHVGDTLTVRVTLARARSRAAASSRSPSCSTIGIAPRPWRRTARRRTPLPSPSRTIWWWTRRAFGRLAAAQADMERHLSIQGPVWFLHLAERSRNRGRRMPQGASTTSHSDIRGLPGQSRMTVFRREEDAVWGVRPRAPQQTHPATLGEAPRLDARRRVVGGAHERPL